MSSIRIDHVMRAACEALGALALVALLGRPAPAQAAPASDSLSTLSGVYTDEQAKRGKTAYIGLCKSCHNPSTGDAFAKRWAGKSVADLFSFIMEFMPDNDPGHLSPTDNADIVGYLLQATGMPAGPRELPAAVDSLKPIRIEMKKDSTPPTPPPPRSYRAK